MISVNQFRKMGFVERLHLFGVEATLTAIGAELGLIHRGRLQDDLELLLAGPLVGLGRT